MIEPHISHRALARPFSLWFCGLSLSGLAAALFLAPAAHASALPASAAPLDFTRQVRPILSENCFTCHGPDDKKRKAGLRLDLKSEVFKPLKSGDFAIVPGDTNRSELVRRINTTDPDDQMPPPKSGKQLTQSQIDLLTRWVAQGAEYKDHWAYLTPERPPLPEVQLQDWARNPIDRFVLARLEQEHLRPSPEATRESLIRRVSLDLTGIPPTPHEVEAFQRDNRPDAYERLVDRLLDSPRYGERWAKPWLDEARYADSNGYEADFRRSIWPYRDWVINALNRDMPFDEFTVEQLAGDLLPNATREQRVATGFHRNTLVNTEGGTDEEEFRVAAIIDRVNTTFGVWMGTTIGCAQCHSHKYDPFTQREYYQLFAFFNQTADKGRSTDPELELPSPAQAQAREEIEAKVRPLDKVLNTETPDLDLAEALWESDLAFGQEIVSNSWSTLCPENLKATDGVKLTRLDDESILSTGALPDTATYELTATTPLSRITAIRLEAIADERLPNSSCGRSDEGDFVLTDLTVEAEPAAGHGASNPSTESGASNTNATARIHFKTAYADFSMEHYGVKDSIDDNETSGWSIAAYEPGNRVDHHAVFIPKSPVGLPGGTRFIVKLQQHSNRSQHLLGRFRLSVSTAPLDAHLAWADVPESIRSVLQIARDDRTPAQQAELETHYRSIDPELDKVRKQIADLRTKLPKDVPSTLVMEAVQTLRPTHILIRGSFLSPSDAVEPGTPAILHPWPAGQPKNRLGLARWMVEPNNPLIGRVTVNRIWAQYFGRGLVETSEDFGSQGDLPTHPELLDWLATEFIRQGWSLKALHRLIVTSATYRQASEVPTELVEKDPFNRLLARGPRFRMEAEMLRDNALAIGGLLSEKVGGPSVFPYQPDGVWSSPYNGDHWTLSSKGDQFRRGLYTFWRRSAPYASFSAFDAQARNVMCERRSRSNTPLQALVTLNDPAFVVAANGLARRVLAHAAATPEEDLAFAFECCVARRPEPNESRPLLQLYTENVKRFEKDPAAARALVGVGLPAPEHDPHLAELAAWTVVSNVLLNLDETLTKG